MDLFPKPGPSDRPPLSGSRQDHLGSTPATDKQAEASRSRAWRSAKLVLGAPLAAFPVGQIVRNGRQLGQIVSDLRRLPKPPQAVPQQADGMIDVAAIAFVSGLSEAELGERLARRRRQTAVTAYIAFTLGWVFVGLWLRRLLSLDWTGQRLLTALQFAPFCLIFFLTAFKHAHANWQMRTGLLGSAGDYVRSVEPFWPRR